MDKTTRTPFLHIFSYSLGDGAFSLMMNTIWGFAMFFYTQALGIRPELTGLILALPMFWDAVIDPIMGFITDTTRSRFGTRHPHILIGGVLLVLCNFFLWYVPDVFQTSQMSMVIYLIVVNMISRTFLAWYYVPYIALGFEISSDYSQRSRIQSMRYITNMVFNLLFSGILVWRVFLVNSEGGRDTTIQANYARMGFWFSIIILILILITVFSTKKYIVDSRKSSSVMDKSLHGFARDMMGIFRDRNALSVFLFYCTVSCSFVFVSSIQMYVYISFMDLTPSEASCTHSSGMIGFALGSLLAGAIARKVDKKQTIYIGAAINILANVALGLIFLTGLLKPRMFPVGETSVASIVFGFFQASYWFGSGLLLPIIFSMVADISEINRIKTGLNKDGSYSAVLAFMVKISSSIALIVVGKILAYIGFVVGQDAQYPDVSYRLTKMMIFLGIFFTVLAVVFIVKYPINRKFMEKIRSENL